VEWKPIITTIQEIFCAGKPVTEKGPGGTLAFSTKLDPAITKADAFVGNVLGLPGKLPPVVETLALEPHLFEYVIGTKEKIKLEPFRQYEPLMLSVGTATTIGIIQQAGKTLKFNLKRPVCARKGQKVAIGRQVQNRWHLIGYGVVL
jgi:translation initiation factor 2 subunit 3